MRRHRRLTKTNPPDRPAPADEAPAAHAADPAHERTVVAWALAVGGNVLIGETRNGKVAGRTIRAGGKLPESPITSFCHFRQLSGQNLLVTLMSRRLGVRLSRRAFETFPDA